MNKNEEHQALTLTDILYQVSKCATLLNTNQPAPNLSYTKQQPLQKKKRKGYSDKRTPDISEKCSLLKQICDNTQPTTPNNNTVAIYP